MYKCKYCGKIFEKKGQIGYHVAREHGSLSSVLKRQSEEPRERYYLNPQKCLACGEIISYENATREKKIFCNHSCAATFNNLKRGRKEKPHKLSPKEKAKEHWEPLLKKWKEGENPPEFSCHGKVTEGDLTVSAKAQIKEILLEEQNHCCKLCGQPAIWNNQPLLLILDHIDGNPCNHLKENLRLICPNCGTQLPTHGNKNRGNGRYSGRISKLRQSRILMEN